MSSVSVIRRHGATVYCVVVLLILVNLSIACTRGTKHCLRQRSEDEPRFGFAAIAVGDAKNVASPTVSHSCVVVEMCLK
jgi:hypothetical protein